MKRNSFYVFVTTALLVVHLNSVVCKGGERQKHERCPGVPCMPEPISSGGPCEAIYESDDKCCPRWICSSEPNLDRFGDSNLADEKFWKGSFDDDMDDDLISTTKQKSKLKFKVKSSKKYGPLNEDKVFEQNGPTLSAKASGYNSKQREPLVQKNGFKKFESHNVNEVEKNHNKAPHNKL